MTPDDANSNSLAVKAAMAWVGTPYVHQASCRHHGTDCLGLVRGVWRELLGGEPWALPPYGRAPTPSDEGGNLLDAAEAFLRRAERSEPVAGDVMVFRMERGAPARHCAIASGSKTFIHAYSGRGVIVSRYGKYWRERLAGLFTFPICPDGALSS